MDRPNPPAKPLAPTERADTRTKKPGRPKGTTGKPRRHDLEALWWIYDLRDTGVGFNAALNMLRDLAFTPGIEILPEDDKYGILRDTDESTDRKRLRRLADRHPQRNDLYTALAPGRTPSVSVVAAAIEGHVLLVPAMPAGSLCSGTQFF